MEERAASLVILKIDAVLRTSLEEKLLSELE